MRLVRRPCVTSVSLAFSLRFTCLFRYSSVFLSPRRTRRSDLLVSTRARILRSVAVARGCDPRDGEPADVFDSWAKKSFARGRSLVGGRKEGSRAGLPAKGAALPLFNLQSLGIVGHARTFRHVATICACVCVAAKWLQSRMLLRVLFIGILNECDRY